MLRHKGHKEKDEEQYDRGSITHPLVTVTHGTDKGAYHGCTKAMCNVT